MTVLFAGLALFLGVHSVRIFADDWRTARIAHMGPNAWKGIYSLISLAGFVPIVYGYGMSRQSPVDLWLPTLWTRHLAALLTLPVFILFAAAFIPGTRNKEKLKHPMILGVKTLAIAHLLSNGRLGDVALFGALPLWTIGDFRAAQQRERALGAIQGTRARP